jgi:preprotein translocase subunit SecG
MNILVICIHVIVCFVLIIVILLQAGRGQGLTGASFGGNVQSLFGTKASSFLTKATSVCAILFLFTCIGLNIIEVQKSRSLFKAPGTQAPLDVEQIKKALANIKKTDKAGTPTTTKIVTDAKTDAQKAEAAAQSEATKLVETLKKEAVTTAAAPAKKK